MSTPHVAGKHLRPRPMRIATLPGWLYKDGSFAVGGQAARFAHRTKHRGGFALGALARVNVQLGCLVKLASRHRWKIA